MKAEARSLAILGSVIWLFGCAQIPPAYDERAGIRQVSVLPDTTPPVTRFDTFAVGAGTGVGKGAGSATLEWLTMTATNAHDPFAAVLFLALTPVVAAGGAIYGGAIAVSPERAATIENLARQLGAGLAIERRLAELVVDAGNEANYLLTLASVPGDQGSESSETAQRSDGVLETDVVEMGFKGNGRDPDVHLYLRAKARLTRLQANYVLGESDFFVRSEAKKLNQWLVDEGKPLRFAFDKLLRDLATEIVDRRLLHYPYGTMGRFEKHVWGPSAISPGRMKTAHSNRPLFVPTIDTLQPTLAWNEFKVPDQEASSGGPLTRATLLGYEVCVWRQDPDVQMWPSGCDYRRRGIAETVHTVSEPLLPDQRYFWNVRLRFSVDGGEYLTGWSFYPLAFDTPAVAPNSQDQKN